MIKLLIIADDFTGALDTGIQFVKKGIETRVIIGTELDGLLPSCPAQVLVVDSETRPMAPGEARRVVARIVRQALEAGVEVIYKKTDSALRGNVGSELSGVLEGAAGKRIYYIPAFPDVNRITRKGVHYIDGIKLEDSGFGRDPFDPVTCSYIPDILAGQTDIPVTVVERSQKIPAASGGQEILVFDVSENEDIRERAAQLKALGELCLLAGCAGFAAFLPEALGLTGTYGRQIFRTDCFLAACGSLNPITKRQVEYARDNGFYRRNLLPGEKLQPGYYETAGGRRLMDDLAVRLREEKRVVTDTFDLEGQESVAEYTARMGIDRDTVRFSISGCYGKIVKYLFEQDLDMTVLMTGGDTLMGFMKEIGVNQISPVAEVGQGTVLSRLHWEGRVLQVISKSGGYGETDVLVRAADRVTKEENRIAG